MKKKYRYITEVIVRIYEICYHVLVYPLGLVFVFTYPILRLVIIFFIIIIGFPDNGLYSRFLNI